jgi:hypothetical protein
VQLGWAARPAKTMKGRQWLGHRRLGLGSLPIALPQFQRVEVRRVQGAEGPLGVSAYHATRYQILSESPREKANGGMVGAYVLGCDGIGVAFAAYSAVYVFLVLLTHSKSVAGAQNSALRPRGEHEGKRPGNSFPARFSSRGIALTPRSRRIDLEAKARVLVDTRRPGWGVRIDSNFRTVDEEWGARGSWKGRLARIPGWAAWES